MEIAIPVLALGGLYLINRQNTDASSSSSSSSKKPGASKEGFYLPNENIPNRNYPAEYPVEVPEIDQTSYLSVNNKYDGNGAYTDKFFKPTNPGSGSSSSATTTTPANYKSMTGEPVGGDYFTHNNMVPFFGSRLRTNKGDINSNEGVLDNAVGSGSQYSSKKEQSPMFSPHDNLQWASGTPNNTEFIKSRMNASSKMNGVKPFEAQQVGPGLGLGYTTDGLGGFNSGMGMRDTWTDRGVDELRVANKPKTSGVLLGYEGAPDSIHKKPLDTQNIGVFNKNRPDTHFEMGADRLFTTMGVQTAPTLRGIQTEGFSHRGDGETSYMGIAGGKTENAYMMGQPQHQESHKIDLGAYPLAPANAVGRSHPTNADYGIKTQYAHPNNRSSNEQNEYFGVISGSIGAVVAPLLDVLRPSRKENTVGTLRPYQNPKSTVSNSYIFNPNDQLPTTMRETTENSKFHLNVNANQKGAYMVSENQAADTNRMTTGDFYYAGGSSAVSGLQKQVSYEAGYRQRNNDLKSSTIEGYMVQGNMDMFNPNVNISNKAKDTLNSRDVVPTMPYQGPDITNTGQTQRNNQLYQNIQLDRNNGDTLGALKGNQFVLSVVDGV